MENNGLLIAALVDIVAVVGLVILFNGQSTGAAVAPGDVVCQNGFTPVKFVGANGKLAYVVCKEGQVGIPQTLYDR